MGEWIGCGGIVGGDRAVLEKSMEQQYYSYVEMKRVVAERVGKSYVDSPNFVTMTMSEGFFFTFRCHCPCFRCALVVVLLNFAVDNDWIFKNL